MKELENWARKLILKKEIELDDKKKKYNKHLKKEVTQKDIVTYLINTNEELYNDYQIYQGNLQKNEFSG